MADYDAVVALEDLLINVLGDDEVDGHDLGGGTMNLFIWTRNPRGTLDQSRRSGGITRSQIPSPLDSGTKGPTSTRRAVARWARAM